MGDACEQRTAAAVGALDAPRPAKLRRRALAVGAGALETHELLSVVAGRTCGPSAATDLLELARASPSELSQRHALPRGATLRLAAAFELGRRTALARHQPRATVRSPAEVFALCGGDFQGLERETFQVLLLDGKHRLKAREVVSVGSLTSSIVHPREVFRPAVRSAAAAVICVHNHPSGDPEPSAEDLEVTRRLHQAGRLLGVPLLDHVVIGDGRWVSLRERLGL